MAEDEDDQEAGSKVPRKRIPTTRWFVILAAIVGVAFFTQRVLTGRAVLWAFAEASVAALVTMLVLGFAQRQWSGDKLQNVQLPGGAGGQFEDAEAAAKTRETVDALNDKVANFGDRLIQLQAGLDRRVSDLEDRVFKDNGRDSERNDAG